MSSHDLPRRPPIHQHVRRSPGEGGDMTARKTLLPRKKLIQLLCRRCYGEAVEDLAKDYGLKIPQVNSLLRTHVDIYSGMKSFLGRSPSLGPNAEPNSVEGIWRICLRCREDFWTGSQFIRTCEACKGSDDWRSGGSDFTTSGVRGLG